MASISVDKILQAVVAGISQTAIAQMMNVSDGLISQVINTDEFQIRLRQKRATQMAQAAIRQEKLESLQDKLIDKVDNLIPFITKPTEATAALRAIAEVAKNNMPMTGETQEASNVVTIYMPTAIGVNFQLNSQNEVIDIDGRTIVGANATQIMERAAEFGIESANPLLQVSDQKPLALNGGTNEKAPPEPTTSSAIPTQSPSSASRTIIGNLAQASETLSVDDY